MNDIDREIAACDDMSENRGLDFSMLTVAAPAFRLRMWRALVRQTAAETRRRGAMFVPTPAAVCDELGFLRRTYWGDDSCHAWGSEYEKAFLDGLWRRMQTGACRRPKMSRESCLSHARSLPTARVASLVENGVWRDLET